MKNRFVRLLVIIALVATQSWAANTWELVGDSITNNWFSVASQHHAGAINGGVNGDTTTDMICRYAAVMANAPYGVSILGGANDTVDNSPRAGCSTTPSTTSAADIFARLKAMYDTALAANMRVVACSILPRGSPTTPSGNISAGQRQKIIDVNTLIKAYAGSHARMIYCDYFAAMVDGSGYLPLTYSTDGLHPIAAGYAVMYPIQELAITRVTAAGMFDTLPFNIGLLIRPVPRAMVWMATAPGRRRPTLN